MQNQWGVSLSYCPLLNFAEDWIFSSGRGANKRQLGFFLLLRAELDEIELALFKKCEASAGSLWQRGQFALGEWNHCVCGFPPGASASTHTTSCWLKALIQYIWLVHVCRSTLLQSFILWIQEGAGKPPLASVFFLLWPGAQWTGEKLGAPKV